MEKYLAVCFTEKESGRISVVNYHYDNLASEYFKSENKEPENISDVLRYIGKTLQRLSSSQHDVTLMI